MLVGLGDFYAVKRLKILWAGVMGLQTHPVDTTRFGKTAPDWKYGENYYSTKGYFYFCGNCNFP
jgi:hypothetical protein